MSASTNKSMPLNCQAGKRHDIKASRFAKEACIREANKSKQGSHEQVLKRDMGYPERVYVRVYVRRAWKRPERQEDAPCKFRVGVNWGSVVHKRKKKQRKN